LLRRDLDTFNIEDEALTFVIIHSLGFEGSALSEVELKITWQIIHFHVDVELLLRNYGRGVEK